MRENYQYIYADIYALFLRFFWYMMCVGGKNKSANRSANNLRVKVMRCMNLNNKILTGVLKVFVNGLF